MKDYKELKLAIIGLGYVGLPLALEFAKKRKVIGFDTNNFRVDELSAGIDKNKEFSKNELQSVKSLYITSNTYELKSANCYIVTVPTPVDLSNEPNLEPLIEASKTISEILNKGDVVIYESTVFPGCVEDECVPILEKFSGLRYNLDFFCGYSPERINPGNPSHEDAQARILR